MTLTRTWWCGTCEAELPMGVRAHLVATHGYPAGATLQGKRTGYLHLDSAGGEYTTVTTWAVQGGAPVSVTETLHRPPRPRQPRQARPARGPRR